MIPEEMKNIKGCVPDGWVPLVTKLIEDLDKFEEEIVVLQVKEKFGGLRFYIGAYETDGIVDLINKAEKESFNICQKCGKSPASLNTTSWWVVTLCEGCSIEHNKSKRNI